MTFGPLFEASSGAPEGAPLRVSELSAHVRGQVEALGTLRVVGELSNPKLHSSGHFYADLKDEDPSQNSVLSLVAWRSAVQNWAQIPTHGARVEVRGKLTTYPARSGYQLQITSVTLAGQGALLAQLEALKARLQAEGLFDTARKRPIPLLPRIIGIVTSPTGAVIADMLHRLEARCPRPVVLAPTAVQGPEAPAQIVAALEALNALPPAQRPDVILVARGGGSLEDLMAFNHEAVVRAVAASGVPVISGVGHEPDVTLCDFAADLRAPTPTAAAELAVPVRAEMLAALAEARRRMRQVLTQRLHEKHQHVALMKRMLPDPERLMAQAFQRLAELEGRLHQIGTEPCRRARERVQALARIMQAHHPEAPLQRGYALVWREGVLLDGRSAAGPMELQFAEGRRSGVLDAPQ